MRLNLAQPMRFEVLREGQAVLLTRDFNLAATYAKRVKGQVNNRFFIKLIKG